MPWLNEYVAEKYRTELFNYLDSHSLSVPKTEVNPTIADVLKADECEYHLTDTDTITATIAAHKENPDARIAVLNFASYKTPGGAFMRNALAQEEYLCYCTNLYREILQFKDTWYKQHLKTLRNGLYTNQSLLSHDITIVASEPGELLPEEEQFTVDILTCAAPNWSPALKYGTLTHDELVTATRERIKYVMRLLSTYDYDNIIVGAYGCGVFKNDPTVVVQAFLKAMGMYKLKHVTFAVPDKTSDNYLAFKNELVGR